MPITPIGAESAQWSYSFPRVARICAITADNGVSGGIDCRGCAVVTGRLDPSRWHSARCGHPAFVSESGVIRFLLGIESYDEATLASIRKGGSVKEDQRAIELLRQHGSFPWRPMWLAFRKRRVVTTGSRSNICCAMTLTRSSCFT